MFADTKKPIYGLMFWNDVYKKGECMALFYVQKVRRDKRQMVEAEHGFNTKAFEVKLPAK